MKQAVKRASVAEPTSQAGDLYQPERKKSTTNINNLNNSVGVVGFKVKVIIYNLNHKYMANNIAF